MWLCFKPAHFSIHCKHYTRIMPANPGGTDIDIICRISTRYARSCYWAKFVNIFTFHKSVFDIIFAAFLCAHNGFAEFYAKPLINEILSWQKTDISCYAFDVFGPDTDPLNWKQRFETDKKNKRNRRSALQLKHNCSDHMSGLALATLTQYLKFRINYYKITEN